jgi:pyruvate dehydrogenase E1 component beta subunit
LFIEQKMLYDTKGLVPEVEYAIPFGEAVIRRKGEDVTIITTGRMGTRTLDAADGLAKEGINCEVIDPRTIAPFDYETVINSVHKTHRLVIVQEAWKTGGFGSEIAATVAEKAFSALTAPIKRVASPNCPVPAAPNLAPHCYPDQADIVRAVKEIISI